ncbi:c-type cytochrome [Candidatus Solirubrobacter pratensis]|uniref:c-type cytochrome n=1 Tax=Candidatus Solirubrobacter pratensis TaxID=1298857 RepID=UPI0004202733|nr:cytochrome c [Candidatus Solirubrobacter pratensis]
MTTLVFVLAFILLGLGTFLVAVSGGRHGLGAAVHSQSRGSRKFATLVFGLALLLLGVGIPTAVIASVDDRNDIPHANIKNLTSAELRGRDLFGERCAACHTLAASNAVAQVGPDLDTVQPNAKLVLSTIQNGRSGNGQMPAGIYTGQDAKDVAAYVAKATGASGG